MSKPLDWLSKVTPEQMDQLRSEADELARLQGVLNALSMDVSVESLPQEALERLRAIAQSPAAILCGDSLILWNNLCRARSGLKPIK